MDKQIIVCLDIVINIRNFSINLLYMRVKILFHPSVGSLVVLKVNDIRGISETCTDFITPFTQLSLYFILLFIIVYLESNGQNRTYDPQNSRTICNILCPSYSLPRLKLMAEQMTN